LTTRHISISIGGGHGRDCRARPAVSTHFLKLARRAAVRDGLQEVLAALARQRQESAPKAIDRLLISFSHI